MSTTNTSGNWVATWDRSGRLIRVYDPTAKPAELTPRINWTDSKPK